MLGQHKAYNCLEKGRIAANTRVTAAKELAWMGGDIAR